MYKEIIYKTNKGKEVFGFLTKVALSEFGLFSFFEIGPFHDDFLELGYIRIYGEEKYVIKTASKFEFLFRKFGTKADLKKI